MSTQQFAEVLAGIWERSKGAINDQVAFLEQAATALLEGALDHATRQRAQGEAHKLAGSVGTFGFTEGTRLARDIEQLLQSGPVPGPTQAARLEQLVAALRQELSRDSGAQNTPTAPTMSRRPLLFAIDADTAFLERLALAAAMGGMHVHAASSLAAARQALPHTRPDAVLLSMDVATLLEEIEAFLGDLAQQFPAMPLVLLGHAIGVVDQLAVTTAGLHTFLQQPVTPARVLEVLLQVSQQPRNTAARVLLVTDDRQAVTALQHYLASQQDIRLTTLHEAERFWQVFTDTAPDLLVLDTTTPVLPGLAWCQRIRCMPQWAALPIVMLTANTEVDAVEQALRAGADDYLSKPITGQDLTVRMAQRLARSRQSAAMLESDALTGLPTQRKAVPMLHQLLYLATRHQQPFSLARLTLDHFARLSNRHGHAGGSEVLRCLGVLLADGFRKSDVVARWDNDTFVVGLYGTPREAGVHRLAEILETLRHQTFVGRHGAPFQATFSAGVATSPQDGADVDSLREAAGEALAQARAHGGERVLPAGWGSEQKQDPHYVDVILVDDDEPFARALLQAFATRGYHALWLPQGQAALARLESRTPALVARLILLNIDLPDIDGLTVIRRLAHDGVLQQTQVIVFTVQATERETLAALDLGAVDYLAKPVNISLLMQRVRHALNR